MGEAKRRKQSMGDDAYRDPDRQPAWPRSPLSKGQMQKAYDLTTRGAWIGIALLAVFWVVVRFIGPAFGWWQLLDV
ncbi:MAG: DUF2839 domain-containing protein [Cyanobacteria bacterium P01_A01_bin.3]